MAKIVSFLRSLASIPKRFDAQSRALGIEGVGFTRRGVLTATTKMCRLFAPIFRFRIGEGEKILASTPSSGECMYSVSLTRPTLPRAFERCPSALTAFPFRVRRPERQAQLEALHAALSREVALIQGPPGTGKVRAIPGGGPVHTASEGAALRLEEAAGTACAGCYPHECCSSTQCAN